ncbi:MAG: PoNe immunity protein domain-containing protein [Flavobacteriales bacterium]
MRDTIRNGGLAEFVARTSKYLDWYRQQLDEGKISPEELAKTGHFDFITNLFYTIAHYSVGSSKADVQAHLRNTIDAFEQGFKWEGFENTYGGYDEMTWMVSLSILCDIELADFKRITAILKRDGVEDPLLNYLIKSKQPDWSQYGVYIIQKSPYSGLDKLIKETDPVKGIERIKTYLEKEWYNGHNDAAWHNRHKNTKVNSYFGYWAWETAALVKAKGWDDTALQGVLYYPYDAVHW